MIFNIPKSAQLSKVKINNETTTSVSTALNGHQNPMKVGSQFFSIDMTYTLHNKEIRDFESFIALLDGQLNTFNASIPHRFTCYDPVLSGNAIANSATSGSTFVMIKGIVSGSFNLGDFIQFGNSSKLYMVAAYDARTGQLNITPRLRSAIIDGTTVKYKSIDAEFRLTSDTVSTAYKETYEIAEVTIKAREAF